MPNKSVNGKSVASAGPPSSVKVIVIEYGPVKSSVVDNTPDFSPILKIVWLAGDVIDQVKPNVFSSDLAVPFNPWKVAKVPTWPWVITNMMMLMLRMMM